MDGSIPASATPSRNRTAIADPKLRTKAVHMERRPKPKVMRGIHLPGPIILVSMVEGISKTM